jgi:hypothetical protein
MLGDAAWHVDEGVGHEWRHHSGEEVPKVCRCSRINLVDGGVVGMEAEAVPGTVGRLMVEEVVDVLVTRSFGRAGDEGDGWKDLLEALERERRLVVGWQV